MESFSKKQRRLFDKYGENLYHAQPLLAHSQRWDGLKGRRPVIGIKQGVC
jgi:hypothetical protein